MKDTMIAKPTTKLTLREVRNQFEAWRKGKKRRSRIPNSLWAAAVAVCTQCSVNQVARALRLNHTALKRRVTGTEQSAERPVFSGASFLELPLGLGKDPVVCSVEFERTGGDKVKMTFSGRGQDFDPLELARVFREGGQ